MRLGQKLWGGTLFQLGVYVSLSKKRGDAGLGGSMLGPVSGGDGCLILGPQSASYGSCQPLSFKKKLSQRLRPALFQRRECRLKLSQRQLRSNQSGSIELRRSSEGLPGLISTHRPGLIL